MDRALFPFEQKGYDFVYKQIRKYSGTNHFKDGLTSDPLFGRFATSRSWKLSPLNLRAT